MSYSYHSEEKARQKNIDEESFNKLFSGLKKITFLETFGGVEKNKEETEKLDTGLKVLEKKPSTWQYQAITFRSYRTE